MMQDIVLLLTASSALWRELFICCAVVLVLGLRWTQLRQRGLFICLSLSCSMLLGRLLDISKISSSPGWRTLDSLGNVSYDFVNTFKTDYYRALALLVTLLVLPWLLALLQPFKAIKLE